MSKLTMIGLYNYDQTLFDNLTLPTGIDKDLAVETILTRSGEFEVLYSSLDFNKFLIVIKSDHRQFRHLHSPPFPHI